MMENELYLKFDLENSRDEIFFEYPNFIMGEIYYRKVSYHAIRMHFFPQNKKKCNLTITKYVGSNNTERAREFTIKLKKLSVVTSKRGAIYQFLKELTIDEGLLSEDQLHTRARAGQGPFTVTIHSKGFMTGIGRTTFTGTVGDKSGTLVIQWTGQTKTLGKWHCKWVILSGTDELANLRGSGIGVETEPGSFELVLSGKIHFDPS